MSERLSYDVVVVGGGPAGTTTALYTTRLGHRTAVFEREGGRHAAVTGVHNLYGVSEDVSGRELARHARHQLEEYGGDYYLDAVEEVRRTDGGSSPAEEGRFVVESGHATVEAECVVFATGFRDVEPSVPGIRAFVGRGLHYCLHCDAYVLGDSPAFVLGHDDHAAEVAMLLLNVTDDVDLLLDDRDPEWSEETGRQLEGHPVDVVEREVVGAFARGDAGEGRSPGTDVAPPDPSERPAPDPGHRSRRQDEVPWLGGLEFVDGTERTYRGGFAMYGRQYNTDLATSLGCSLTEDRAIEVSDDQETDVAGAYAVGDVTHGQNQTTLALADGASAGLAIHKSLRRFPRPVEGEGPVEASEVPAAPADLRARMRLVRDRPHHAGLGASRRGE